MLQRIARGFVVIACVCFVSLAVPVFTPDAPVVKADDSLTNVKEGLADYKKGKWEDAIQKFDEALARNPNDDAARQIRDEIGAELARAFIENNFQNPGLKGRYSRFGKWVMTGLSRTAYSGRNNNPEEIKQFVDDFMSDADTTRNMLRGASIREAYGDFAVPYIQHAYLHSENQDYRYRARLLLATLGAQAVPAIIQIFYSAEMYDRQGAALALGDIADVRALPILAKHFQIRDEEAQVREACRSAIEIIRRKHPEQDRKVENAKDLFFLQAEGMYRNNAAGRFYRNRLVGTGYQGHLPVPMYGVTRTYTIWKWIPDHVEGDEPALVPQEVPLWSYADIMAEESAMQAFELGLASSGTSASSDSFVRDTEALLACIHMHMYTEGRGRYYNTSSEEKEFIERTLGERGFVPHTHGWGLGAGSGSPVLYAALERSLADGYPQVSAAICDAIADLGDTSVIGKPAGAALLRALNDPERVVRYAAARAFIRLGANISFGNNALVEQVVVRNLQETQARTVLVIVENESLRSNYLASLESMGHSAVGARTLEEGADMAMQGPPWDAIIIEGDLAVAPVFVWELPAMGGAADRGERSEPIFHLLKDDIRTAAIPVLVSVLESDLDNRQRTLASLNVDAQRFVTHTSEQGVEAESVGQVLEAVWSENVEDAKSKTNGMVVAMADALAQLDPENTKYAVDKLLVALAGGLRLEGRSSAARAAICNAIARLVTNRKSVSAAWVRTEIVPNLLGTLESTELVDRPLVKGAASRALGAAYGAHRAAWDEDGFNALKGQLRLEYDLSTIPNPDHRSAMVLEVEAARNAAGEALGKAPTTPQQRLAIKRAQAVNPHAPHPDTRAVE